MAKYRRKPIFVEAVQWNKPGDDIRDALLFDKHEAYDRFGNPAAPQSWYIVLYQPYRTYGPLTPGCYILTYSDGTIEVKTQEEMDRDWEKVEEDNKKKCSCCGCLFDPGKADHCKWCE